MYNQWLESNPNFNNHDTLVYGAELYKLSKEDDMERFTERDTTRWYKWQGMQIRLASLSDSEFEQLRTRHVANGAEYAEAQAVLDNEAAIRDAERQQVADLFAGPTAYEDEAFSVAEALNRVRGAVAINGFTDMGEYLIRDIA